MPYDIPLGYRPLLDAVSTRRTVAALAERSAEALRREFAALVVDAPAAFARGSGEQVARATREVSFDTRRDDGAYVVAHSPENYLRQMVGAMDVDYGHALLVRISLLTRDTEGMDTPLSATGFFVEGPLDAVAARDFKATLAALAQRTAGCLNDAIANVDPGGKKLARLPAGLRSFAARDVAGAAWPEGYQTGLRRLLDRHKAVGVLGVYSLPTERYVAQGHRLTTVDPEKTLAVYVRSDVTGAPVRVFDVAIRPDGKDLAENRKANGLKLTADPFASAIADGSLPVTWGLAVRFSQFARYALKKAHVAEVVSAPWPRAFLDHCEAIGLELH